MDANTMSEITNTCNCEVFNDNTREYDLANECFGCYEEMLEDFEFGVKEFFNDNPTNAFRIEGFPVWNGTINGYFDAKTPKELLDNITPDRAEWILRYQVKGNTLECVLSHHDAPTGGFMTITYYEETE